MNREQSLQYQKEINQDLRQKFEEFVKEMRRIDELHAYHTRKMGEIVGGKNG